VIKEGIFYCRNGVCRADWGIVGGKPQIYEINTNPFVSADPGSQNPTRRATMALSTKRLCRNLAALETGTGSGTVAMDGKLLSDWRKKRKWYERPEPRP
jgi:hypothetical protein